MNILIHYKEPQSWFWKSLADLWGEHHDQIDETVEEEEDDNSEDDQQITYNQVN